MEGVAEVSYVHFTCAWKIIYPTCQMLAIGKIFLVLNFRIYFKVVNYSNVYYVTVCVNGW